jgi:5-methylcytosine-specific restriction endonuclease McrA
MPPYRTIPDDDPRRWYAYSRHRKRAKHQLKLQPFCVLCERDGKAVPAELADHIVPHRGDWNAFRMGELQSLCWRCHSSTKKIIEHKQRDAVGVDGFPIDPTHPVYNNGKSGKPAELPINIDDLIA